MSPPPRRGTGVLLLPALLGTGLLLLATRRGVYLSPDALAYVGTARNLAGDAGYTPPPGSPAVSNFPPLFPLLLAGFGALGVDPLTAVRYLNPLLFGLTALVVGLLVRRLTGRLALAVVAELLVLAGADFLMYATSGLSEPLFLLLAVLAVAALVPCLPARRPILLVVAAQLAGAATLTRYVGVALIAGGAAAFVLAARRWRAALAFTLMALAPPAGWFAWLAMDSGRTTNRPVVWHGPGLDYVANGLRSASRWFVPDSVPYAVRGPLAAALAVLVVVLAVRSRGPGRRRAGRTAAGVVALVTALYLGALVVDRSLFEVTGRLDERFLLPVHLAAIALALWGLGTVDLRRSHLARLGLSAVVGLQVVSGLVWLGDAIGNQEVRPGGFAAPSFAHSEVVDQVRALAVSEPVYTNQVDLLWLHTGRVATPVPEKAVFLSGRPNRSYDAQVRAMGDDLARGGLLVYFTKSPARRVFLPTPDELANALGLQPVARDAVGVAYRRPSPPGPAG